MEITLASDHGTAKPARWSLRLFGGFEVSVLPGGERVTSLGKRERVLLACLALNPKGQPRRKLAALLWGDATDETLLDNLRACVWKLRKALGDTEHRSIASEGEDIVLDGAAFEIDVWEFRRLAAQSGRSELEAAAKLYSGELLEGLDINSEEFESWRRAEATHDRGRAVDVLARLMAQLCESGESERAIETGERILRLEPLHEAAIRRLMGLHAKNGRRAAAVQLYRTLADALRTEFDGRPEAETRLAFSEIARGGEDLASDPPAADVKVRAVSAIVARSSEAPREPLRAAKRAAFGVIGALALAGGLIVAITLITTRQFAFPGPPQAAVTERTAFASPTGGISVAVLPFTNMSADASQEFFSDGITEEITAALAKIPGLRVVARTSAFQFKAQNRDIQSIGQQLHATHFIEGSVRKEGGRVRVTAQLVEADNGIGLWSDNYDRELKEIFTTQEDIAQAIAMALRMPLGLQQGDTLVRDQTTDLDSYQEYLRAKALVHARGMEPLAEAVTLLEKVVLHDPDYAPAWALLTEAYVLTPDYIPVYFSGAADELRRVADASLAKADKTAPRAIQLAPNLAEGYLALGFAQQVRGKWVSAEDLLSRAVMLDRDNPDGLHRYANLLAAVGRLKESLSMRLKLQALEPFVPIFSANTAAVQWMSGQNDAAVRTLEGLPPGALRGIFLSELYASQARYREAADAVAAIPSGIFLPGTVEIATSLLRKAPVPVESPQTLPRLGQLSFVYLHIGVPDHALDVREDEVRAGYIVDNDFARLWYPSYAALRKTERFKTLMRKSGLVEYWRARGWPQFCHPTTSDDFACV